MSVPNSPTAHNQFDITLAPIPPPRTKRKQNIKKSDTEIENPSENLSSIKNPSENLSPIKNPSENLSSINAETVEINTDQSVMFTKCEPNVRPNDLNLQLDRKISSNLAKDESHSTTSVDSDDQSLHTNSIGSPLSSPTETHDLNDKLLSKLNSNHNNNQKLANNDKSMHSIYKKKKIKIIDLRLEDKDESMVSRIISKFFLF